MAPEAFWEIHLSESSHRFMSPDRYWIISMHRDVIYRVCLETQLDPISVHSESIGQFFLSYAYSTPAGIAYRLAYGVPKP